MSSTLKLPPNAAIPYGLCQCGCGQKPELAKATRPDRHQVKGEPLRFVWGHQSRRYPMPPEGFRRCSLCGEVKPHDGFYKSQKRPQGLQKHCKVCSKAIHDRWKEQNPGKIQEHVANARRRKEFGVEPEQYRAMMEAQDGVCALCGQKNQRKNKDGSHYALTIDHCHSSGAIRGLLCNMCNPLLGYARDDVSILKAAIVYLKKHGR